MNMFEMMEMARGDKGLVTMSGLDFEKTCNFHGKSERYPDAVILSEEVYSETTGSNWSGKNSIVIYAKRRVPGSSIYRIWADILGMDGYAQEQDEKHMTEDAENFNSTVKALAVENIDHDELTKLRRQIEDRLRKDQVAVITTANLLNLQAHRTAERQTTGRTDLRN